MRQLGAQRFKFRLSTECPPVVGFALSLVSDIIESIPSIHVRNLLSRAGPSIRLKRLGRPACGEVPMKIVVSVHELSTETQLVIDNMRRSDAPVLIGDPNKPTAVLLSLEEYERLLRESQKLAENAAPQPAAVEAATTPIPVAASAPQQPAQAEVVPASKHSDIAQRTATAVQADRSATSEPRVVSQRASTLQPDPTLAAKPKTSLRGPRLTRPLPKPPGPLQAPKPRLRLSPSAIPGGWQTIAMVVGMLALGVVGFALIVSALGG